MDIKIDNLEDGGVLRLLEEHLADMYATSPPESVHALDVEALKSSEITFFSAWNGERLMGCVAIKQLDSKHVELKSMRTANEARQLGVASQLLQHVIDVSVQEGYQRMSLETGSDDYFLAARNLYEKFGFRSCGPFSVYELDPHSQFMNKNL
ncbi:GNAT family N-acetyltransferase [Vibrio sp. ZSDE26]|uniref:GNAT family N-acetyltransferase n=1 Tax=Vibrio amylolyticus TaxID=2847292 RepID=A0A9X2BML0_9VIBR|nr:GNAT family N-acetyltransferase [Vibrio amylolyticus]MCK6265058.1 GNAT family N-acetyltransferase [Vibrio amylolyticus]